MLSILFLVICKTWFKYGGSAYFLASSKLGPTYLTMLPSATVNNSLPLHFRHLPANGGLLYFSLQSTHLNCCCENCLKFPFMSRMKCLSISSLATSFSSTHLSLSASFIWPFTLSIIVGIDLYALHLTPAFKSSVSCVKPSPSYSLKVPRLSPNCSILISFGDLYSNAAS